MPRYINPPISWDTDRALLELGLPPAFERLQPTITLASFIVERTDTEIRAIDGRTGRIRFSGTDASTVIQRAIDALDKGKIFIKRGEYELTKDIFLPSTKRIIIEGEGFESTILKVPDGTGIRIYSDGSIFYFSIRDVTFLGENIGTGKFVLTIGKDDFSDAFNSGELFIHVHQKGGTGGGLKLNYVLDYLAKLVCDTDGGFALQLRQTQFSDIFVIGSAIAGTFLDIVDGYVFNNFIHMKCEKGDPVLDVRSTKTDTNVFIIYTAVTGAINVPYGNNVCLNAQLQSTAQIPDLKRMRVLHSNFVLLNSGTATITSGSSGVDVSHGLAKTPSIVIITGHHSELADAVVTAKGITTFTVTVPAAVTADRTFDWYAEV